MEKLWKHVFPTLLQLACDVEQVNTALPLGEPLAVRRAIGCKTEMNKVL